jgi:transglutaminase-like putative cysteine protease
MPAFLLVPQRASFETCRQFLHRRRQTPVSPHDKTGVCRDRTHLAVAFCRCMNIPARYCTGYLGDIGVPPPHGTPDFAAWFEAFLGGRWHTFDARNNTPRSPARSGPTH